MGEASYFYSVITDRFLAISLVAKALFRLWLLLLLFPPLVFSIILELLLESPSSEVSILLLLLDEALITLIPF
jgi:hypothetical protein